MKTIKYTISILSLFMLSNAASAGGAKKDIKIFDQKIEKHTYNSDFEQRNFYRYNISRGGRYNIYVESTTKRRKDGKLSTEKKDKGVGAGISISF